MRFTFALCLTLVFTGAGCAYEGTVVRKEFRLVPASASLGIDALYRFELRDHDGNLHSQMVSEEVFASYQIGDYFDDWQRPPIRSWPNTPEPRLIQPPLEEYQTRYRPIGVIEPEPPGWR